MRSYRLYWLPVSGLVLFALLRVYASWRTPGVFGDSSTYNALGFFGEQERLWVVPLVYNVLHAYWAREAFQTLLGIFAWSVLAIEVKRSFTARYVQAGAAAAVLVISLLPPVTMWDADMLSESITLSLGALVVALLLRLRRSASGATLAVLLAGVCGWMFCRQENVLIYLCLLPLALVMALRQLPRGTAIAVCVTAVAVGGWGAGDVLSQTQPPASGVWEYNAAELILDRLQFDPSALRFFAQRGLPVSLVRQASGANHSINWLLSQPAFARWDLTRFKSTYAGWLLQRMPAALIQPFSQIWNEAIPLPPLYGSPRTVVPASLWRAALVFGSPVLLVLLLLCVTLRRPVRVGSVSVSLLVFAVVMAIVNYEFGTRELQRLFLPGAVALRLALILAIAAAAEALSGPSRRSASVRAAPRDERAGGPLVDVGERIIAGAHRNGPA